MMARSQNNSDSKSLDQARPKHGPANGGDAETSDGAQSGRGYRKPPKSQQWKKGQSGNPSGRKKGSKNKRTIITELMEQKLGRKIDDISKLSRYEGMLLKGIQKALSGDTKAMAFILRRYDVGAWIARVLRKAERGTD
jgi:hypothetical protein